MPIDETPFYWENVKSCDVCGEKGKDKSGVEFHGGIVICQSCLWLATIAVWDQQVKEANAK